MGTLLTPLEMDWLHHFFAQGISDAEVLKHMREIESPENRKDWTLSMIRERRRGMGYV
jgi:hypothetical protein